MSFAKTITAAIVMVLVILVVAVPVVSHVSHEPITLQNEPLNSTTYTYKQGLSSVSCEGGKLYAGSAEVVAPTLVSVLVQSENMALVYAATNHYALFYKPTGATMTVVSDLGSDWSFTPTGNSFTVTYLDAEEVSQSVTGTTDASKALTVTATGGSYVAIRTGSADKFVNDGSRVYVCINAVGGKVLSAGSIIIGQESQTVPYLTQNNEEEVPVTPALTDNEDGSYTLGSVKYRYNGTDTSYTSRIIPISYQAEVVSTGPLSTIVGVIPLMLAVGVLVAVAVGFLRRD